MTQSPRKHRSQSGSPSLKIKSPSPKQKKTKRLAKACDNCHRGKRKCDGTGPCSTCFYAGKTCIYTNNLGVQIPPPVRPHDDLQTIIDKIDLNQREYAMLTYRTTTSAAASVVQTLTQPHSQLPHSQLPHSQLPHSQLLQSQPQPYVYQTSPSPSAAASSLLNSPSVIDCYSFDQGMGYSHATYQHWNNSIGEL
ncbi:hypothetical protein QCA50_010738 [Cerrena zonata]|uniref:Zn(2)-C6 fungal-type domain-containing protein n=1 Tax=Cerrena zonata TaxID=2478898 RepID=A0AAW0G6I9_9APHY